jgi:hypothetical protein
VSEDRYGVADVVERLRARAATCDANAETYDLIGYPAEALCQRARAAAYRLAAEDVSTMLAGTW